jgi:prepilin-type N-terminal cleavage/methylation domain-containing protein
MWANKKISSFDSNNRRGFTIVELLIVIVVIAILAAIVIVAYQGVNARANASAAQSGASDLAKLLSLSNTNNGTYPSDLSTVNNGQPMPSGSTSYVYHPGTGNTSYCATVTTGSSSYKITDAATTPVAGGCPGDGVGGVAAITNLITNPSFEGGASGWGNYGNSINYSLSAAQAYTGTTSMLLTEPSDGGYHGFQIGFAATAGNSYNVSAYIYRISGASNIVLRVEWYTSASVYIGYNQINTTSAAGSWARQSFTTTAPANTGKAVLVLAYQGATTGESFYADGVMATQGSSISSYADGTSPSWIWNGAANNSTSTGPPQ